MSRSIVYAPNHTSRYSDPAVSLLCSPSLFRTHRNSLHRAHREFSFLAFFAERACVKNGHRAANKIVTVNALFSV